MAAAIVGRSVGTGRSGGQEVKSQGGKDDLLQSLSSQFNMDFSSAGYDQWQRKTKVTRPKVKQPTETEAALNFTVGRRPSAESAGKPVVREKRRTAKEAEEEAQRAERIRVLELRLFTKKKTLQEYEQRFKELLTLNQEIKSQIEAKEEGTHDVVKKLLRKYEKYRGGIETLNTNFSKELAEAKHALATTQDRVSRGMAAIEKRVADMDAKLQERQGELNILNNYKDKEYPVKAMKIANLKKEIEDLSITNQEDTEDLEHIINTELGKYHKERQRIATTITKDVTEKAIEMMHPSLKDMALQNMVMAKEIEFHKREQEVVQETILGLEEEVEALLRSPKTNVRLQMFPEFFPPQQKCTPDMDVVLDIPTQKWLPI